jgi:hypothetical protein
MHHPLDRHTRNGEKVLQLRFRELTCRYFEIEADLKTISTLKKFQLSKKRVADLKLLKKDLDKLFLVMKALQRENITMYQVCI